MPEPTPYGRVPIDRSCVRCPHDQGSILIAGDGSRGHKLTSDAQQQRSGSQAADGRLDEEALVCEQALALRGKDVQVHETEDGTVSIRDGETALSAT